MEEPRGKDTECHTEQAAGGAAFGMVQSRRRWVVQLEEGEAGFTELVASQLSLGE